MKSLRQRAALAALVVIGLLFALAVLSVLTSKKANAAADEFRWKHFGADPLAQTRTEALAIRERVFRESFGFSDACVGAAMQATANPGRAGHLNVGDRLAVMVSAGFIAHRPTIVDFAPVRRGIDYAALVETWEFECDGQHQKIGLPEICNNWSLYPPVPMPPTPVMAPTPSRPTPKAVVATGACPKGAALIVQAWTMESIYAASPGLGKRAEEQVTAAIGRDSENASNRKAYMTDALSRTLGNELVRVVNVRAPVSADIAVTLLDPVTLAVVEDLGNYRLVDGMVSVPLTDAQKEKIVQTIWPGWFSSPTVSGGARRLWLFPDEWWGKPGGLRWCTKDVHGVYKKDNKP